MKKYGPDFMTHQERHQSRYGVKGYELDSLLRVKQTEKTKMVDYAELIQILKSKDEGLLERSAWIFEDLRDAKFLDPEAEQTVESLGEKTAYMSYPRCGNSFLRKYL